MKKIVSIVIISLFFVQFSLAQRDKILSEESEIPAYQLPDVLTRFNGSKVKLEKTWFKKQRPEIMGKFTEEVYGKVPGHLKISEVKVWETSDNALQGTAFRKQLSLYFKIGINYTYKNFQILLCREIFIG